MQQLVHQTARHLQVQGPACLRSQHAVCGDAAPLQQLLSSFMAGLPCTAARPWPCSRPEQHLPQAHPLRVPLPPYALRCHIAASPHAGALPAAGEVAAPTASSGPTSASPCATSASSCSTSAAAGSPRGGNAAAASQGYGPHGLSSQALSCPSTPATSACLEAQWQTSCATVQRQPETMHRLPGSVEVPGARRGGDCMEAHACRHWCCVVTQRQDTAI